MADFTATDDFSEIIMHANTKAAKAWMASNVSQKGALRSIGFATAPGYMVNHVLPELRAAGLTVDGDVDTEGRAKIRVRV